MKTDKISFGTKPSIGVFMADVGLRKYNEKLTEGILDAFEKLSKNGINDELNLHLGVNGTQKQMGQIKVSQRSYQKFKRNLLKNKLINPTVDIPKKFFNDILQLSYKPEGQIKSQSSKVLYPKKLEKLSKENISKLILETYEKLKISNIHRESANGIPYQKPNSIIYNSEAQTKKIEELIDKFGYDDSSLLV